MNPNIVLAAQQFALTHFCDIHLTQEEFSARITEAVESLPSRTERITFLTEVIRLGNSFLNDSHTALNKMEEYGIAHNFTPERLENILLG